jgi:glycosyltransferase involved in cell wall biosynthesis
VSVRAAIFDPYAHVLGGAQRIDVLMAGGLAERGFDVRVVTTAEGPLPAAVRAAGGRVDIVPTPGPLSRYGRSTTGGRLAGAVSRLPGYWAHVRAHLRRERIRLVHVVDHRGMVLAGPAARAAGARVVWHLHAADPNAVIDVVGRGLAHRCVIPSPSALTRRMTRLRPDAVDVVPSPLLDPPAPLGELAGSPVVVTLSRRHPDKGLDVLLDAWPAVIAQVPAARLRIVGPRQEGYEEVEPALRAQAAALGIADSVAFVDETDDALGELRRARCYVQPSRERTESFGMAVLEAMAAGTPVVVSDVSGLIDLVQDGHTGLVVAPENPAALGAALVSMLTDGALIAHVRGAAYAAAVDGNFSPETYLDRIVSVWNRAR